MAGEPPRQRKWLLIARSTAIILHFDRPPPFGQDGAPRNFIRDPHSRGREKEKGRLMLIIDTHAHIYGQDEKGYPPIDKPLRPPGSKRTLGDLRSEVATHGLRGACLIQTSTFYRFDNRYICDSARVSSDWAAGVCTLDPDDPHSPGLLVNYHRDFGI